MLGGKRAHLLKWSLKKIRSGKDRWVDRVYDGRIVSKKAIEPNVQWREVAEDRERWRQYVGRDGLEGRNPQEEEEEEEEEEETGDGGFSIKIRNSCLETLDIRHR